MCYLINNSDIFDSEDAKLNLIPNDYFDEFLLICEYYLLLTIKLQTHCLKYENEEMTKSVFNKIFEKINEFKKYKESSSNKIFSPHFIIIRCYSLFLDRFCFDYSIKHGCELLDSFNHFLNLFPQSKELNEFIFQELIAYLNFMNILQSNFNNHYKNFLLSINCDFSLIRYLMTQPEMKNKFNIRDMLSIYCINSYNKYLLNLLNSNTNNIKVISKRNEKYLKYNNSLIDLLYLMMRDTLSLEKLAFGNVETESKIEDEIYEKLYQVEKDKINILIKNKIIHFILSKQNLVKRNDCIVYLKENFDDNYTELVDEILKNNCEKRVLANGLLNFSLKKEILNKCDIGYITSSNDRAKAIEYMNNFHSNIDFLNNLNIIEPINIEKKLMKNIYMTFYNEKNINDLIKLYNLINSNTKETKLLNQIFNSSLTKIFSFSHTLCSTDLLEEDFKIKLLEKMNLIENKKFLKEKINDKKDKKNLKEKLKKKYGKKYDILKEKIIQLNIFEEEEIRKDQEYCVYCRQSLNKDINDIEYFGKICDYFSDYITDITKKNPENKRKRSRKFVTCNHKIHFKCFNELIRVLDSEEFECPVCKKLSNIILFDFSYLDEKNTNCLVKGLNYKDEKMNFDEFYETNESDKYNELFVYNIISFENYSSKLFNKEILIADYYKDDSLLEKTFNYIFEDFEEFTMYYSRTDDKKYQLEIWRNILYNIKILFQYKVLEFQENILSLFDKILKINSLEIYEELLTNYDFCDIINIYIITSFILLEPNETNKEKNKNIFQNKILIYLIYIAFIKSNNNENIDKFFDNGKTEIKNALDLYYLKYKIFLLLLNEKEEDIKNNISLEQIISSIKYNSDFNYLINSSKKDLFLKRISKLYLGVPEFININSPDNILEFMNRMIDECCIYCNNKKNKYSYLCLLCGNKLCNDTKCAFEIILAKGEENSLVYHSKQCCGGNGIFLEIQNCEIIYIFKRRTIKSNIFIYMNEFGETFKDNFLSDKCKLNKDELKKGIMEFNDLAYRKKYKDPD